MIITVIKITVIAPAARASERGGILALPHVKDAEIFLQLFGFFSVKRKRSKRSCGTLSLCE